MDTWVPCGQPGEYAIRAIEGLLYFGDYYEERTPLRRIARRKEAAGAIAFFLSDDASYCTSSELLVDGGFITNVEYL
jgi:NAD(P)-dependent dehydrogenase (short-subunit alcohol dehydrogenase family)